MTRLGKPKGSRNKKTLEKLAAAASKTAGQESRTDSPDSYPSINNDVQLFSHTGLFDNLPGSEPHVLQGQIDPNLSDVSDMFGAVSGESTITTQRLLLSQLMEDTSWAISGERKSRPWVSVFEDQFR